MGSNIVWWHRRHSVSRIQRIGDWIGMGKNASLPTPLEGAGSPGEPAVRAEVKAENGMRVELERAARPAEVRRVPGRPRKER